MDPTITIAIVGLLAVVGVGGVAAVFLIDFDGGDVKKRIGVEKQRGAPVFGRRKAEASLHAKTAERLNELHQNANKVTLRLRLTQAGMRMSPAQFMLTFQVIGAAAGFGAFLASQQLLVAAGVAVAVAFGGPRWWLNRCIDKRRNNFNKHFPAAIDIMVRGVKSGLPVTEGLKVIANEIPDPVKGEFRLVVDTTQMGVSLEDALARMAERMPTQDVNFFRTVLAIQKQTGGNLAEALSNLSATLRERHKIKLKLKALTAEARVSAIILGCLPLVVGGAVYLLKPDYIKTLWLDDFGQTMLYGAGIWMTFGVLTLRAMVNFKT